MAEKVLNDPLSGEEIILAVLDFAGQMLRQDCYLTPNTAYQTFSARVTIQVSAQDTGREVVVERVAEVHSREELPEEAEFTEVEAALGPAPPNKVRVEAGLPVPVQVKDERGRLVTKPVRYARKKAGKD